MNIALSDVVAVIAPVLARGQRVRMSVAGDSMVPFIRDGDTIELEPLDAPAAVGDVVLARVDVDGVPGRHVVHRVITVARGGVCLRGDAQMVAEGPLPGTAILGRVCAVYRADRLVGRRDGWWGRFGRVWAVVGRAGYQALELRRALKKARAGTSRSSHRAG